VRDRIGPAAGRYRQDHPTWGYRRIWRQAAIDGIDLGSPSSVARALRDLDRIRGSGATEVDSRR
jgi:hypothetical protein